MRTGVVGVSDDFLSDIRWAYIEQCESADWPNEALYQAWKAEGGAEAEFDRAIAAHDAEVRESIAREIRDYFYTDEHVGMSRNMAEMYEEIVSEAARVAEQGPDADGRESSA